MRAPLAIVALALALASLACGQREAPSADPFPGLALLARVEARLERERAALRPMLEHYRLVFPVEPDDLDAFMETVRVHGHGADLALGFEQGLEAHGGGILHMLVAHWRPDGRAARLEDRFPFEAGRRPLALADFYDACQHQLYLPRGAFPQLPRMQVRFRAPGEPVVSVDSDAYHFLALLVALETDRTREWTARNGKPLSLALLMQNVRAHYLAGRAAVTAPYDHTNLHLVELLVAYGGDLAPVQRQFLDEDLAQEKFAPLDADFVLPHHAESLGHLLSVPALAWSAEDRQRVLHWLGELEERMGDVDDTKLQELTHLAFGLRAVRAERAKLE